MKYNCQTCSCEFNSKTNLIQHEKNSVYCNNFAYILFLCKQCFKSFHNIKDIQNHLKECLIKDDKRSISIKLDHYINQISSCKKYTKLLQNLQYTRREYLNYVSLNEYTQFILIHLKKIKSEFDKRDNTKIPRFYSKVLSPFELRLIKYKKISVEIDTEERDFLKNIIQKNPLYIYLNSYCIALFSIKELKRCFLLKLGKFNNKHYYRPNIKKNVWIFDEKLTYFSLLFIEEFITYCTSLYRDLYKRVFGNNKFENNMDIHSPLIEYDCNQLLFNLFMVSNYELFQNFLLDLELSSINDTAIFKDSLKSKKKIKLKSCKENIGLLYDNIEDNKLEEFLENCKKKFSI